MSSKEALYLRCLPHWARPDSDSCCLDKLVDFCAFSTSHWPKFVWLLFSSLHVEWIVVSIYKEVIHHWCNISGGKPEQLSFELSMLVCVYFWPLKCTLKSAVCLHIGHSGILQKFTCPYDYFHFLLFLTPPSLFFILCSNFDLCVSSFFLFDSVLSRKLRSTI